SFHMSGSIIDLSSCKRMGSMGLFHWNTNGRAGNPSAADLDRRRSWAYVERHPKVHLVGVDSAGVPNCPEHLGRFSVDGHINGRIDYRQWTRWERLARFEGRAGRPQAGSEQRQNLARCGWLSGADE